MKQNRFHSAPFEGAHKRKTGEPDGFRIFLLQQPKYLGKFNVK